MLAAMSKWLYEESPTESLKFEEPLKELKAKIAESGSKVFQDMVREFLVENKHRTTVELAPSRTLEAEIQKVRVKDKRHVCSFIILLLTV